MKEITLTFKDTSGKSQTTRFAIWRRADLERKERFALMGNGAELISGEDWDDETFARYEKAAALAAGIERGEAFLVKFEYI